jgi:hypothetical protein
MVTIVNTTPLLLFSFSVSCPADLHLRFLDIASQINNLHQALVSGSPFEKTQVNIGKYVGVRYSAPSIFLWFETLHCK